MILFAIEFYYRRVWSVNTERPILVEWNDITLLQTLNLLRIPFWNKKFLIRLRFWEDRFRLGLEYKFTNIHWRFGAIKKNTQWKWGLYVYCNPYSWRKIKRIWKLLGWPTKTKVRQSLVLHNTRATLDNKKKLEIKIHRTPVI